MFSKHTLYFGDCRQKLASARMIFSNLGKELYTERIRQTLEKMNRLHGELSERMMEVDFPGFCSSCSRKEGGGCCSLFMADENETLQLLMNLMDGVEVDIRRDDGFECYFLGEQGCLLRFKPMFCLNYDCQAVQNCDDQEAYRRYLTSCGDLLREQWQLEQLLLDRLQELGQLQP